MKQRLNNISKIFVVEPSDALELYRALSFGEVYAEPKAVEELALSGLAELEVTSYYEEKELLYSIKLTAALTERPESLARKSYIVQTVLGQRLLFGFGRRPYPQPSLTEIFPSNPSDRSIINLTVEYTSKIALYMLNNA